ncbi:MAG: CoB--CoM heterodisulfide reductase iron-sulfur subunit B family protein [Verrucomicrobia bacterium]|nr:CoB--CoM heterodisulfide reductase iron-sulfur subunit B family protein [Verrucomicrobiota bacterium]
MKYAYFPGCSLKGMGRAYEESLLPVMKKLGVEFNELEDWNCCGATAYMAVDEVKACVLASRNLAIAERAGNKEMVAPCSACYLVLNKAKHYFNESPIMAGKVKRALKTADMEYSGDVDIRHPLDILTNDIGIDEIKKHVTHPLKGLKVATYYGCQIVRPYSTFDDQNNPQTMDRLIEALGAEVVHYPLKTKCCGGSLTGTLPEAGLRLCYILLNEAIKQGADVIATVCPLCQFNLDAYHDKIKAQWGPARIPVVYFSQLMGLAYGMSEKKVGLQRNIVKADLRPKAAAAA